MLPFPFFLALKYLRPKRTVLSVVTVISVLGVLLGVAILVIVMSVMTGFDNMWRDKILSFRPHLTVTGMRGVVHNESRVAGQVEQVPGVVGVAPVIETLALAHHAGVASAPIVIGIDPERAGILSHVQTNLVDGEFSIDHGGALIGIDEARKLGAIVGSRILVYSEVIMQGMSRDELYLPEELEVRGIFNMGMQKFDQGFIITSLDSARDLVGMDEGVRRHPW